MLTFAMFNAAKHANVKTTLRLIFRQMGRAVVGHGCCGLGLLLANATIERMGGKVRLFNREGGGATTEIVLPWRGLKVDK